MQTEIRYCSITAKRDDAHKHDLYDLTAFNTDGTLLRKRHSAFACLGKFGLRNQSFIHARFVSN
jgi:hypothetical protein